MPKFKVLLESSQTIRLAPVAVLPVEMAKTAPGMVVTKEAWPAGAPGVVLPQMTEPPAEAIKAWPAAPVPAGKILSKLVPNCRVLAAAVPAMWSLYIGLVVPRPTLPTPNADTKRPGVPGAVPTWSNPTGAVMPRPTLPLSRRTILSVGVESAMRSAKPVVVPAPLT